MVERTMNLVAGCGVNAAEMLPVAAFDDHP
jgi:hypothetical protein